MKKRITVEIGQRYNFLTVISFSHSDKRNRKWYNTQCTCGNEKVIMGSAMVSNNTKSCGCYQHRYKKEHGLLPNNLGVKRMIIKQYVRHAKDRNIEYSLSEEKFIELIEQPCYYCGIESSNIIKTKNYKQGYPYNGIDRIDSLKGYTNENCVPCCGRCNKAKLAMSKDEFLCWVKAVYLHSCL